MGRGGAGTFTELFAHDSSAVTMTGGFAWAVRANDSSIVTIAPESDTTVYVVAANDSANVTVNAGVTLETGLGASGSSNVTPKGGWSGNTNVRQTATPTVNGAGMANKLNGLSKRARIGSDANSVHTPYRPEQTVLYPTIREHLENFLARTASCSRKPFAYCSTNKLAGRCSSPLL
jgi:hypothetical protein